MPLSEQQFLPETEKQYSSCNQWRNNERLETTTIYDPRKIEYPDSIRI